MVSFSYPFFSRISVVTRFKEYEVNLLFLGPTERLGFKKVQSTPSEESDQSRLGNSREDIR